MNMKNEEKRVNAAEKRTIYFQYDDSALRKRKAETKRPKEYAGNAGSRTADSGRNDEDLTPQIIYDYLNERVWKQEKAKRRAALLAYKAFERGIRENAIFVGPTGCGKTYIWRCLQELFPDRIRIVDGSNITQDGWKGEKKWSTLMADPMFAMGRNTILVIDEADKMLSPRYTGRGENYGQTIASEGLKFLEGCKMRLEDRNCNSFMLDTEKVSFVLCGAFSNKAEDIAEQNRESGIGFGCTAKDAKPYEKPMDFEDLIEFGVLPEFLGRFQSITNLEVMTEEDYFNLLYSSAGPLVRISRQYGAEVKISRKKRRELAGEAYRSGLGIRGMESKIRELIDEAMFEDCQAQSYRF